MRRYIECTHLYLSTHLYDDDRVVFSDNVTNDYVLRVGQIHEVRLLITVRNSEEEAHEATLSVEMPPAFDYVGTDDRVCTCRIYYASALIGRRH